MGNSELLDKCRELRELRNMAAELDNQIDALEDAVKQEMQQRGVDKLFIGDCHVSWLEYTTHALTRGNSKLNTVGYMPRSASPSKPNDLVYRNG